MLDYIKSNRFRYIIILLVSLSLGIMDKYGVLCGAISLLVVGILITFVDYFENKSTKSFREYVSILVIMFMIFISILAINYVRLMLGIFILFMIPLVISIADDLVYITMKKN